MIALALLAVASAQADQPPLIPAFFTGDRLFEICERPNAGQCSMYVAGVVDGVFQAETDDASRSLCSGDQNNREAAKLVTDYLRENPESRARAAAAVVKLALKPELGCDSRPAS